MRAIVFVHTENEGAGLLGSILQDEGIECHEVGLYRGDVIPPFADYQLMLVMGGPQQVWELQQQSWLKPEIEAIRHWVEDLQRPYMGICLGHQLLAVALGGQVAPAKKYELGFPSITMDPSAANHSLFQHLPSHSRWMQWHSAEITEVPLGFHVIASSSDCAVQAMSLDSRVVSLQFHAECDSNLVEYWRTNPEIGMELEALDGEGAVTRLAEAAAEYQSDAEHNAALLFRRWLALNSMQAK